GWVQVDTDVPCIVRSNRAITGRIDPDTAGPHDAVSRTLFVPADRPVEAGDRITLTAPRGTGLEAGQLFVVSSVDQNSLAPCLKASIAIEETAVETWPVTIERWSDAA